MRKPAVRPYLISKDVEGAFRITVRTTRLNSQGYPLISSSVLDGGFPTIAAARTYARETFRAAAADIATE